MIKLYIKYDWSLQTDLSLVSLLYVKGSPEYVHQMYGRRVGSQTYSGQFSQVFISKLLMKTYFRIIYYNYIYKYLSVVPAPFVQTLSGILVYRMK